MARDCILGRKDRPSGKNRLVRDALHNAVGGGRGHGHELPAAGRSFQEDKNYVRFVRVGKILIEASIVPNGILAPRNRLLRSAFVRAGN